MENEAHLTWEFVKGIYEALTLSLDETNLNSAQKGQFIERFSFYFKKMTDMLSEKEGKGRA